MAPPTNRDPTLQIVFPFESTNALTSLLKYLHCPMRLHSCCTTLCQPGEAWWSYKKAKVKGLEDQYKHDNTH